MYLLEEEEVVEEERWLGPSSHVGVPPVRSRLPSISFLPLSSRKEESY